MTLGTLVRAALAEALGMALILTSTAQAANVDAASFLSACPGPIFVAADTTLVGSATVTGDCTVSSSGSPGPQLNLSHAKLTFTGFFKVLGNASSLTVDKSKVTTGGDLVLDSFGVMTISGSALGAGGSINLPPRDSLEIALSSLLASGQVTLGGIGGLRNVIHSDISAGTAIVIAAASGAPIPPQTNVLQSTLSAGSQISLGGQATALAVDKSTLEALGAGEAIVIAPGGGGEGNITSSTLSAPAGSIQLAGASFYHIEDATVSSGAGPGITAITVGGGVGSNTCRRAHFTATMGGIFFTGVGSPVFEDCKLEAAGEASGVGIQFGARFGASMTRTTVEASAGAIQFNSQGDATVTKSTLTAEGAGGILVSSSDSKTITDSKLDAALGQIKIVGFGSTGIVGSALTAMNTDGMLLSCAGNSEVTRSRLVTLGEIRIPNGGASSIVSSNLEADAGFITETGGAGSGNSDLLKSRVTGSSITVRSFFDTTVEDNKLNATTFEFSAAGTCTSIGNKPDIPCL